MANPNVTAFVDTTATTGAVAVREAEVTTASFTDGGNWGGSNAPGIGINISAAAEDPLTEDPNQWTLLDQFAATRQPQDSSYIGNTGLGDGDVGVGVVPITAASLPADALGDLTATITGNATLVSLAEGWTSV